MFDDITEPTPGEEEALGADPAYPGLVVSPDGAGDGVSLFVTPDAPGDGTSLIVYPEEPVALPPATTTHPTLVPPGSDVTMAEVLDHLDAADLNNPALTPPGYTAQYDPSTGTVEYFEPGSSLPTTPTYEQE